MLRISQTSSLHAVALSAVALSVLLIAHTLRATTHDSRVVEIAAGVYMPVINLGTGNHAAWLAAGGRGIDTAYDYGDAQQQEIGVAIRNSGVPRSEIFVTTKVPCCPAEHWCGPTGWWQWPPIEGPGGQQPREIAETNLTRLAEHDLQMLGLDVVDMIILHFPCATHELSLQAYRVYVTRVLNHYHPHASTLSARSRFMSAFQSRVWTGWNGCTGRARHAPLVCLTSTVHMHMHSIVITRYFLGTK